MAGCDAVNRSLGGPLTLDPLNGDERDDLDLEMTCTCTSSNRSSQDILLQSQRRETSHLTHTESRASTAPQSLPSEIAEFAKGLAADVERFPSPPQCPMHRGRNVEMPRIPGAYAVVPLIGLHGGSRDQTEPGPALVHVVHVPEDPVATQALVRNNDGEMDLLVAHSEQQQEATPHTNRSSRYKKPKLLLFLSLEVNIILFVVILFLLGVLLTSKGGTRNQSPQNGIIQIPVIPGEPPVVPATPATLLHSLNLPEYTLLAMENPRSPQSKAYQWLMGNINNTSNVLQQLPAWRFRQRFALATFYYSTRGDYWVKKHGWMDWDTSECQWEQLLRNEEDNPNHCNGKGEIKRIIFYSSNNIAGTIPPELCLLNRGLESLWIFGQTELKGTIPAELGCLTKLSDLWLFTTGLSGTLPSQMGLLGHLTELSIFNNQFSGSLPSELGELSELSVFYLATSDLTGSVPAELVESQTLKSFSVLDCPRLNTDLLLQELVTKASQLERLDLANRGGVEEVPIPTELGSMRELALLSIVDWKLNGTLPSELRLLTNLSWLDFSQNMISGRLPQALSTLSNLQWIYLESNKLEGPLSPLLATKLPQLQVLQLHDNQISGSIPTEFGVVSNLKKLELYNTGVTGTIPSELLVLKNLSSLVVTNTSLSGSIPEELCDRLYQRKMSCFGQCHDFQLKTSSTVCLGTSLCGCDCAPCQHSQPSNVSG